MNYFEILLIGALFIVNLILAWKILKNKRVLTKNEYDVINLTLKSRKESNIYTGSYFATLGLLGLMQVLLICSLFIFEFKVIIYIGIFYIFLASLIKQSFYISKDNIGTLYKINNTKNIKFIEVTHSNHYGELKIHYNDNSEEKVSIRGNNLKGLINKLRDYKYKVHCKSN